MSDKIILGSPDTSGLMYNNNPMKSYTTIWEDISSLTKNLSKIQDTQENITKMLLVTNGMLLKYVPTPTDEMINIAVKNNGLAIQFVDVVKQTPELQQIAIEQNPRSLQFIINPTTHIELSAASASIEYDVNDPHPIKFIKNKSYKVYETFLRNNDYDIEYIKDDISDLDFERVVNLWYFAITGDYDIYGELYSEETIKACPYNIQSKIIRIVLDNCSIGLLRYFDKSFWHCSDIIQYIIYKPFDISIIDEYPVITPVSWMQHIINELTPEKTYLIKTLFYYFFTHHSINTIVDAMTVLSSNYPFLILNEIYEFQGVPGISEYIFENFNLEDIKTNLNPDMLKIYLDKLPFFTRMKYKIKLYKIK